MNMKKIFLSLACAIFAGLSLTACSGAAGKQAADSTTDTVLRQEAAATKTDAQSGATPHAGKVSPLTMEDFSKYVMNLSGDQPTYVGKRPAVIDFYATWCGPCKRMAPILEELAAEYAGKIDFYQIDVDKETELAAMFGIQAMPTFAFISADGQISQSVGMMPKEDFKKAIEENCLKK